MEQIYIYQVAFRRVRPRYRRRNCMCLWKGSGYGKGYLRAKKGNLAIALCLHKSRGVHNL
jgi:hypothetical protein